MADPRRISPNDIWLPRRGLDPAKYLLDPGGVKVAGSPDPGQLQHARPYISNGANIFLFPVGVEGFTRASTAQLGLHRYIGDNAVDGAITHREEARITLTGTFPGITAQDTMVACFNMLRSIPISPAPGLILYTPGVFDQQQYVLAENWDFTHAADDRTHSIDYTIAFVVIGTGQNVKDPPGKVPPQNPTSSKTTPKGKSLRIFTVTASTRTFKAIAKAKYGTEILWAELLAYNTELTKGIGTFKLPTYRWPIGTKINY